MALFWISSGKEVEEEEEEEYTWLNSDERELAMNS